MAGRYKVPCADNGTHDYGGRLPCGWSGYRKAKSSPAAGEKPCPRCGARVDVFPMQPE